MLSSSFDQVLATLVVALAYLALVRLADVNEREPIWSLLVAFVLGGAGAAALHLSVDPVVLNFGTWPGTALRELASFAALAVTFGILTEVGRLQGWSEVSDSVDGLIYGAAAGLGFACGEVIANLDPAASLTFATGGVVTAAGVSALTGLAQGVFGAILGAGFGLALTTSSRARWTWPLVALVVAIAAHAGHELLAHGNALGGDAALWRSRVALALPLIAVVAFGVYGLVSERRAIARELSSEAADGYVTADDLALLMNVGRRQLRYVGLLASARVGRLRTVAALHNRQVMLALAKRRLSRLAAEPDRAQPDREVVALRRAILITRARLDAATETRR